MTSNPPPGDGVARDSIEPPWWTRPVFIGGVAGIVAALALGLGVVLSLAATRDDESAKGIDESLSGPLFAFAGAVVITGVVGLWVSAAGRRLEERRRDDEAQEHREREHRSFLESQIVALWGVHDRLKTSAVLISAHRTAKTYSEQIKEIIAARTRLSDVGDTVARQRKPLVSKENLATFQRHIETAARFLHPLIDEYRDHYLDDLSYRQRVDEVKNKALDEAGSVEPSARSTTAWRLLESGSHFPAVKKLLDFGKLSAQELDSATSWNDAAMTVEFLNPLTEGIAVLVSCCEPNVERRRGPSDR